MKFAPPATLIFILGFHLSASGLELNGFDTTSKYLDERVLVRIGPANHPVKALDWIKSEPISSTDWNQNDLVIGVAVNGEARAYPVSMMVWHQLVNDELGGEPILVTFCDLCGTSIVYNRMIGEKTLTFGMAGLLYRSDVLLYDSETNSLWSRFLSEAVTGPSQGTPMDDIPMQMMSLGEWKAAFPESTVLARENGLDIDYTMTPSGSLSAGDGVYASLPKNLRYHPDMPVLGLKKAGKLKAYPAGEILLAGGQVEELFEGVPVKIQYLVEEQSFKLKIPDDVEPVQSYWSEWSKQAPESPIFKVKTGDEDDS